MSGGEGRSAPCTIARCAGAVDGRQEQRPRLRQLRGRRDGRRLLVAGRHVSGLRLARRDPFYPRQPRRNSKPLHAFVNGQQFTDPPDPIQLGQQVPPPSFSFPPCL